jgi:hypothetical protein
MDLKNSVRKYDASDSIGQRIRLWKSSKIHSLDECFYVENQVDIYKSNSHDHVGQATIIFGTALKDEVKDMNHSEVLKKILPKIEKIEISPGKTFIIPLSQLSTNDEEIIKKIKGHYYRNSNFQQNTDSGSKPFRSSSEMSPGGYGIAYGWMANAPLLVVLIFIMPFELAILVLASIVIAVSYYGVISNMNKDYNLFSELVTMHFFGLFVGVPTWHLIILLYWLFT